MEQAKQFHEKDLERLQKFCLMDDDFMSKCFEDNLECTELVVHIVLNRDDLKIQQVHTQHQIKNLQGRLSPSRKKGHEKARKNGMNHRNAEGCSLTLPGRSSVFQIAREKVLPKRSEAAACCKMLPCKRRRPPEQRRVSGTASGE